MDKKPIKNSHLNTPSVIQKYVFHLVQSPLFVKDKILGPLLSEPEAIKGERVSSIAKEYGSSWESYSILAPYRTCPLEHYQVGICNPRARTRGAREQRQVIKNNDDHRSKGALLHVTSEGGVLVFFTDCKELIRGHCLQAGKAAATYAKIQVQTRREPYRFPVAPRAYTG